jgi:glycosyltransferase involved in cell wall biosynthesis
VLPVTPRPYISVVTPSLNQGRYLQEAIRSVANQQYENCEHIVVDALSTDETLDVLKAHEDSASLRWISEADRGQSDALNKGVRMARGEWILWLNADDLLLDGALDAFAEAIERQPQADVFYGHQRFIDAEGRALKTVFHLPYRYPLVRSWLYLPPSTGSLYRKLKLLQQPLKEDLHFIMDREWFLRCGEHLQAVRINRSLSAFRVTNVSKTGASVLGGAKLPRHVAESEWLWNEYGHGEQIGSDSAPFGGSVRRFMYRAEYYFRKSRFGAYYLLNAIWNAILPRRRSSVGPR